MPSPRMEQVFFHTHSKISHSILRHSSHRFRSTIEHVVLGLAVCGFCVVLLSHVTFVHRGDFLRGANDECIQSAHDVCEGRGGVSVYAMLIQLVRSCYIWLMSRSSVGANSDTIVKSLNRKQIPMNCLRSIPGFSDDADVTHIMLCIDHGDNGCGSRAFALHSGRQHINELIVTGAPMSIDQAYDDMYRQLSSCVIADEEVSATDQRAKRREKRGQKSIAKCPTDTIALLSRHGYLPNLTQNTTTEESSTNPSSIIYSYSHSEGLLLLSPALKQAHNITSQFVIASSSDTNCFGEPFVQNIVFSLVGPDTVILNWVLGLQQYLTTKNHVTKNIRFVHHWKSGKDLDLDLFDMDHYAFSSSSGRASNFGSYVSKHQFLQTIADEVYKHPLYRLVRFLMFKVAVFLSTLFIFFLTTSLVSFTFQETQDRMLEFTLQLQTYVRARLPLGGLIVRHILENVVFVPVMVGMVFFLIEFYEGDKFLAFMVLSMVWIAEVFSAISVRSIQGMHFFPRVFFLYFTLFHVYFFSCPIGFTYASLASTLLFLFHTMLFFVNRYELPAINAGLVTAEIPRMMGLQDDVNTGGPPRRQQNQLPQVPDLTSRGNNRTSTYTNLTEPLSSSTSRISAQQPSLTQNPMRSYVLAASTSIQSIRSLASMQSLQSLAGRASPNWLYASGGADGEEDEDSFMAYVGDGARSSLSMSVENR